MKRAKILALSLFCIAMLNVANACHQSTVTYLGVTENANGTVTYDLQICIGFEDTWGFQLTFNTANIVGVTPNCLLSASSGLNACATVSGNVVEFGNMDNTGAAAWLPGGNGTVCYNISVTLDAPASSVDMYGAEWNFGPCSSSAPLPSCLPSAADYTVYIQPNDCGPNNADLIFDGVTVVDGVPEGLGQQVYNICGCATNFSVSAPVTGNGAFACAAGVVSYSIYNSSGTLLASGGGGSTTTYGPHNVSCVPLNSEFIQFEGNKKNSIIELNWSIFEDKEDVLYLLERSLDLTNWHALEFVKSSNSIGVTSNYNYLDKSPSQGTNYYRITVINPDGIGAIHNPIAVHFDNKKAKVVKRVNLLGQEIGADERGYIIEIYDDNSAKKIYRP